MFKVESHLLIDDAKYSQHPDPPFQTANDIGMLSVAEVEPGKVRSSDKNVDHRPVHPVQHILEHQVFVAVENAVEGGADAEQQDQGRSVNESHRHLVGSLRSQEQQKGADSGRRNPEAMSDNIRDVFDLKIKTSRRGQFVFLSSSPEHRAWH